VLDRFLGIERAHASHDVRRLKIHDLQDLAAAVKPRPPERLVSCEVVRHAQGRIVIEQRAHGGGTAAAEDRPIDVGHRAA